MKVSFKVEIKKREIVKIIKTLKKILQYLIIITPIISSVFNM
jgi:hypothetical protein